MGVGKPENILEGIASGIDMFDCVMPTRNARHGYIFTAEGVINIKNSKWKNDFSPLDATITPEYSKAYMRHLILSEEYLGAMAASLHNLRFYLWLVEQAREQILAGTFSTWKTDMLRKVTHRL